MQQTKADDGLYIFIDLCKESIVKDEERPLLRDIMGIKKSPKSKWNFIFNTPFCIKVAKNDPGPSAYI